MPDTEQAIRYAYDRGRAKNRKKQKVFRYLEMLVFGVMTIATSSIALDFYQCIQNCPVRDCNNTSMLDEKGVEQVVLSNLEVKNSFVVKNTKFKTIQANVSTEYFPLNYEWEIKEGADPTRNTKNINKYKNEPVTIVSLLRGLSINKNGASEIFDDVAYNAILDPGIFITSF